MSNHYIGVDMAYGEDKSVVCYARTPRWYEKVLFKLNLIKPFEIKVVKFEDQS